MTIGLHNYRAAPDTQIEKAEKRLGFPFPVEYRAFLREYDGAVPEDNVFRDDLIVSVDQFVSVVDLADRACGVEGFPACAVPIAECSSGNFVYIKKGCTGVFFWDHEVENDKRLANSFKEFLEGLRPFDTNSIQLKPGQVKSVWVDPDFKPKF